jgi:hypothetical protein
VINDLRFYLQTCHSQRMTILVLCESNDIGKISDLPSDCSLFDIIYPNQWALRIPRLALVAVDILSSVHPILGGCNGSCLGRLLLLAHVVLLYLVSPCARKIPSSLPLHLCRIFKHKHLMFSLQTFSLSLLSIVSPSLAAYVTFHNKRYCVTSPQLVSFHEWLHHNKPLDNDL